MPDEFLTVDEVAQLLRLNPQTVRNMIDRGELPAVRVGARRCESSDPISTPFWRRDGD
jgi:excisionase family DNA binding protein